MGMATDLYTAHITSVSWRHTNHEQFFTVPVTGMGSFSNDNGDGNENVTNLHI